MPCVTKNDLASRTHKQHGDHKPNGIRDNHAREYHRPVHKPCHGAPLHENCKHASDQDKPKQLLNAAAGVRHGNLDTVGIEHDERPFGMYVDSKHFQTPD